jgi:hypothetical protein
MTRPPYMIRFAADQLRRLPDDDSTKGPILEQTLEFCDRFSGQASSPGEQARILCDRAAIEFALGHIEDGWKLMDQAAQLGGDDRTTVAYIKRAAKIQHRFEAGRPPIHARVLGVLHLSRPSSY